VRSSMLKGLAVAIVVAAVVVPAAAAKPHHSALNLALIPLPKARLGAAAAALTVTSSQSGAFTNGKAEAGYQLTYGSPFLSNAGLDYVETFVNEYKSVRAAKRDLVANKKEALRNLAIFTGLSQLNLTASGQPTAVPGIRHSHWAVLETFSVANYGSVYLVGVDYRDGKYILESAAAAGSQQLALSHAATDARILDGRLHLGLKGRLHGHPVELPKPPKPGPPASGTDPAMAVLQTSDLAGSLIEDKGYSSSEAALSSYELSFHPAGSFDSVQQTVTLMPSVNSAAFVAAFSGAIDIELFSGLSGGTVSPVDVSAVDDDAQAAIISSSGSGATSTSRSSRCIQGRWRTSCWRKTQRQSMLRRSKLWRRQPRPGWMQRSRRR
jgi:hypothetical protein